MARKTKIYIAGPMRGIRFYNVPAFDEAAEYLREEGFDVVSPPDMDRARGFNAMSLPVDTDWSVLPDGWDKKQLAMECIGAVAECDAVYALPNWSISVGAIAEVAFAVFCGLPVVSIHSERKLAAFSRVIETVPLFEIAAAMEDSAGTTLKEFLPIAKPVQQSPVAKIFEQAVNCNSLENGSNTPDFILGEFLSQVLAAADSMIKRRDAWYVQENLMGSGEVKSVG